MSGAPRYIDISAWQSENIDWTAYAKWAAQWDGIPRVALRSSYGNGYVDAHYQAYRQGAARAGCQIIHYHYSYPQYNSPIIEADWQHQVVGQIGPNDMIMLDYEENVGQATANWAYLWLARQETNYGQTPTIYASDSYIRQRFQDNRLTHFPLTLAYWQFNPAERPPCPPPWSTYMFLQYTDKETNIPGIPGPVDANIYLGEPAMLSIQEAANYFEQIDDQHWHCKQTGFIIQYGILQFYKTVDSAQSIGKYNGLSVLGLPLSAEVTLKPKVAIQRFETAIAIWDPEGQVDIRPGKTGDVFLMHINPLYKQVDGQTQQIMQLQQQIGGLQQQLTQDETQLANNKELIAHLQNELETNQPDPLDAEMRTALLGLKPLIEKVGA